MFVILIMVVMTGLTVMVRIALITVISWLSMMVLMADVHGIYDGPSSFDVLDYLDFRYSFMLVRLFFAEVETKSVLFRCNVFIFPEVRI
jgi:hypothetical protein